MRTYIIYFALIILVSNGSYALVRLAQGNTDAVSLPLLFGSICAAVFALFVIRKRIRQSRPPE